MLACESLTPEELQGIIAGYKQQLQQQAQQEQPWGEEEGAQGTRGNFLPTVPPLDGSGIFGACNPNRSRRLAPTNLVLHTMRTTGGLPTVQQQGGQQQGEQPLLQPEQPEGAPAQRSGPSDESMFVATTPNRSRRLAP